MRSLILITITYIILYKFLIKNLLKDVKTLKINEIPISSYKSKLKIDPLMRRILGRVGI